jgi:hypothetical protein
MRQHARLVWPWTGLAQSTRSGLSGIPPPTSTGAQTQTTRVRVEASESSDYYQQLAVEYLEMARGITGDPIKDCSPAGWATLALLEQLRYQS